MNRRPTDEQAPQTGDSVTDAQATTDAATQSGAFSAELQQEPTGDDAINNPNIINR